MLKLIVPLAGSSELFQSSGYSYPKPLIEIKGKPMIQWVVERLALITVPFQIIFIIHERDATKYHLDNSLRMLSPSCKIVKLKKETKGALCSVLMSIDHIEKEDTLIIVNGDQIIDEEANKLYNFWQQEKADAGVVTFKSVHPRWSYARIENNLVVQTAEKNPISNNAIAGYYYFRKAEDFFEAAFSSIIKDVQLEGQYYIAPVMNEYVLLNKKVVHYPIENSSYHSFYSPQLIKEFDDFLHYEKV